MGVMCTWESEKTEMEAFCRKLVVAAGKDDEGGRNHHLVSYYEDGDEKGTWLCVTSGVSYVGLALVNHLLQLGYSLRITVENPEEMEKVKEIEKTAEGKLEAIMAKLTDIDGLEKAFQGSCARTASIKRCVFTSSLAACVWQDTAQSDHTPVINHGSWSSESFCIEKKLWYALGKMRAEKAAWRIAIERGFTTICPALITRPQFCHRNPTATIAYLKGGQEMYSLGLLVTVDVTKLAEAHASVLKAMNSNASGRYICFDKVIDS
ncbi:Tetraketide alpha-pyrone reductase [Vigna angularis]|uniref:Tetraketide alpha-pyrone reductase n=1 Tax=Phaseolus angularis TaxID=3914 RepID=A0A8T0JVM5_PHAAN|nr:Tetraketide alpha-pyrone reductase [Vigna angularis]